MKQILRILFCIGIVTPIYGQTISTTNSGALSNNNLIYSVGEVFVIAPNQNESSSGLIGAISRIEFNSLSVNEVEFTQNLTFYPNPTSNSIFIEVDNKVINNFFIFDLNGKFIENKRNINNQVDLSNLQTGNYIIKTDNPNIKSFKIIKR
jgi:hypothetical protein